MYFLDYLGKKRYKVNTVSDWNLKEKKKKKKILKKKKQSESTSQKGTENKRNSKPSIFISGSTEESHVVDAENVLAGRSHRCPHPPSVLAQEVHGHFEREYILIFYLFLEYFSIHLWRLYFL